MSFNTLTDGYDVQAVAFAAPIYMEGRERGCSAQLHPMMVNAHSTGPWWWRDKAPKAHVVRLFDRMISRTAVKRMNGCAGRLEKLIFFFVMTSLNAFFSLLKLDFEICRKK